MNAAVLREDAGGVGCAPPGVSVFCRWVGTAATRWRGLGWPRARPAWSRPGAEGFLELGVLLERDLDRLGDHVRPVRAATEVLRVLLHSSDELSGKPQGHGLELDRDLGLNAMSFHGPPSPKPSAWLPGEGQGVCRGGGGDSARDELVLARDYGLGVGRKMVAGLSELRRRRVPSQI